jgi:hypothetical protein
MAKNDIWKNFEQRIQQEAGLFGITIWQVPTNVRIINKAGQKIPIPIKSRPDFVAGIAGLACFFDAKTTQDNTWNLNDYVFRNDSSANKLQQWVQLEDAAAKFNIAGYLVLFVNLRLITWAPVHVIQGLRAAGVPSLSPLTEGCTTTPDDVPINLKHFMSKDILSQLHSIRAANPVAV